MTYAMTPTRPWTQGVFWAFAGFVLTFAFVAVPGFGLYVLPFAILLVAAALLRPSSGPQAVIAGAAFMTLLAILQTTGLVGVTTCPGRCPPSQTLTETFHDGWLATMVGAAVLSAVYAVGSRLPGYPWVVFVGPVVLGLILAAPTARFELRIMVLGPFLLLAAGAARCTYDRWRGFRSEAQEARTVESARPATQNDHSGG